MGSGVSKPTGRHSDSRVVEVRSGLMKESSNAGSRGGFSTVTLKLSPEGHSRVREGEQKQRKDKLRALSLPIGSGGGGWQEREPSTSPIQAVNKPEKTHAEANVQSESPGTPLAEGSASTSLSASSETDRTDRESDEFYEDDFEDDIGDWRKGDSIGSGSYGTVYLARDERTGGLMAVKEILIEDENDADISSATKEVDLLRSLRDDHVVRYIGSYVDLEAKKLFIFTEWVPGGNLEQNRKRFGCNESIVRRFTHQILLGVAYLHSKNIVHHDIKPSNILVDQHGVVKLADFGASRLISSSTSVNNESMRGTPNYMAPEAIKQSSRSRKSDIWSVGCSVLRLLTGLPFWGDKKFDSQISLLYYVAHLETLPPLPGELSDDARSFITACLEIDPVLRPSALELLQHPFVQAFDPIRSPPPPRSTRVQSAPPTADNFSRTQAVIRGPACSQTSASAGTVAATTASRGLHSAPSQLNLPQLRGATAAAAPVRQDKFTVLSGGLPNAFDLPVRSWYRVCGGTSAALWQVLTIYSAAAPQEEEEEEEQNHGEASIPSISTTVLAVETTPAAVVRRGDGAQHKRTPKHAQLPSLASPVNDDIADARDTGPVGRSDAVPPPQQASGRKLSPDQQPRSKWEERPILTDAARLEREQRVASLAAEKLKREERERRFQEELVEFRRLMGHHQ
ncbi:hypothetical protein PybrP1_007535 [[Pythium] brassicae (nom. inval.)]|nr:hypothetical protein PybrP1_007535 [[Pythium] brassicae (nom. inval.)]